MKSVLLAIIAIISLGFAVPSFAAEIPFPVLTTDDWTGTDVKTFYPDNSTYIVQISVHYQYADPLDPPNQITWYDVTGQSHTIQLKEEIAAAFYPVEAVVTPIVPQGLSPEDSLRIIAEKKKELEISADNGFSKLRQCLVEFEEEQPVRFEAWKRTADLTEFEIPDQWVNADTYDRAQLEAQKKWVICDMLKKYQFIGAYEANKSTAENEQYYSLDPTDSPDTVEVTDEALAAEAARAEKFSCTNIGHQRGLCDKEFTGVNRGDKDGYSIPSWYGTWQDLNAQEVDTQRAIEEALVSQCTNYYPLYEHQVGQDSFPHWLEHCVPP